MKLHVAFHGGARYDVTSGKHRVVTDQPLDEGGHDAGMSPVEFYVGALASSVGLYVGRFCAHHDISRDGLTVDAEWHMVGTPPRVSRIALIIHLPHRLTLEQKEQLMKRVQECTVHQSIAIAPAVAIQLNPHSHTVAHS
ncbi:MAG TPA: OsmC family protein [Nitrospiraceae bacterium]|jgi:uncharacterized OsmC-like protein